MQRCPANTNKTRMWVRNLVADKIYFRVKKHAKNKVYPYLAKAIIHNDRHR